MQHKETRTVTSTTTPPARGLPALTPVGQPTRRPIAIATLVAHATSTPSPTATPVASPTATARTTPTPHATPTVHPTATPLVQTVAPRATATPRETVLTPAPAVATPRLVPPRVVPTPSPTPLATAIARATPVTFGGVAQSTVRRYLDDLIAGNETGAYAALGKSPGEGGLSEEAFIDRGTRIVSIRTTSTDPTGATVEVRLSSGRGAYYATYHVLNGPSGPVIDQHDYIRE